MTSEEQKKLRKHYHALVGQLKVFDDAANKYSIDEYSVNVLASVLNRLQADFPGMVPPFKANDYFTHRHDDIGRSYYNIAGLRTYVATAIGILKVEIEAEESTPVVETRTFSFIQDGDLRKCLERDYAEIQRAFVSRCWKSVIILSGGAIEAILTDLLLSNFSIALASSKAPKQTDITRWDLSDLINVSVETNLVSAGIEKLSHSVREYRNLVHPGNEIRNKLTFDAEEARISLEVLNIVHRDLSK